MKFKTTLVYCVSSYGDFLNYTHTKMPYTTTTQKKKKPQQKQQQRKTSNIAENYVGPNSVIVMCEDSHDIVVVKTKKVEDCKD